MSVPQADSRRAASVLWRSISAELQCSANAEDDEMRVHAVIGSKTCDNTCMIWSYKHLPGRALPAHECDLILWTLLR